MGWQMQVVGEPNPRAIQNWMMQASGAEMLRAAVVKMFNAGLTLCATAHDAIMIEAPVDRLAEEVALAREIMERVSLSFTRGLTVRTDARILRPGERYLEPRATRMWQLITELLNDDRSHARQCTALPQWDRVEPTYGSDPSYGSDGSHAMGSKP